MKKVFFIIFAAVVVVAVMLLFSGSKTHYWKYGADPTEEGGQPYDMDFFDELMRRSLPNGYRTVVEPMIIEDEHDDEFDYYLKLINDNITYTPADTSLLVVQSREWVGNTIERLAVFAENGGKALLVVGGYYFDPHLRFAIYDNDKKLYLTMEGCEYSSSPVEYTPGWFAKRDSRPIEIVLSDTCNVTLDSRFTVNSIMYNMNCYGNYEPDINSEEYKVKPLIYSDGKDLSIYAIELNFPHNGGRLCITTLGLYFCNLGLALPGGNQVRERLMDRIDDRPVKRVDYYGKIDHDPIGESTKSTPLDVMRRNPASSFALTLMLVAAVLLVVRGLMRRHPVDSTYVPDDGLVSASHNRLKRLRRSPLLMRLYQTSWLYRGDTPYNELFMSNVNRMARMVKRYTAVELKNATDADVARAAKILADRQALDIKQVTDDLTWMRDSAKAMAKSMYDVSVSKAQFMYSQRIVERYPRVSIN